MPTLTIAILCLVAFFHCSTQSVHLLLNYFFLSILTHSIAKNHLHVTRLWLIKVLFEPLFVQIVLLLKHDANTIVGCTQKCHSFYCWYRCARFTGNMGKSIELKFIRKSYEYLNTYKEDCFGFCGNKITLAVTSFHFVCWCWIDAHKSALQRWKYTVFKSEILI